jgi:hypothetical protein
VPGQPPARVNLRQLWWLLLLIVAIFVIIGWRLFAPVLHEQGVTQAEQPGGQLNGFDLSTCLVDRALIVRGAPLQDAIPPLVEPPVWQGGEVAGINEQWRRERHMKALVVNDAVIGVELNSEVRAYPVCILNWHEVANDTLGGEAIAVVYCPLTASAAVVRRTEAGRSLELAASGLLYNSNTLLYDRHADAAQASLYSQLNLRAVAGPAAAAGEALEQLPAELTLWGDWLARHPATTVLSLETGFSREYDADTYGNYYDRAALRFPVAPLPPADGPALMARCLAVRTATGWRIYSRDDVLAQMGAGDTWEQDGLRFQRARSTAAVVPDETWVERADGAPVISTPGLWFALHAFMPDAELCTVADGAGEERRHSARLLSARCVVGSASQ